MLPLVFYLDITYGADFQDNDEAIAIIHSVSALTHAHRRSQIACGIYLSIASMILDGAGLERAVQLGIRNAAEYYDGQPDFADELGHFSRLKGEEFKKTPRTKIYSSGYVVSSLEAAIWCLLNTHDYAGCVLEAVNLGDDTDTVDAIAGRLAPPLNRRRPKRLQRCPPVMENTSVFLHSLLRMRMMPYRSSTAHAAMPNMP